MSVGLHLFQDVYIPIAKTWNLSHECIYTQRIVYTTPPFQGKIPFYIQTPSILPHPGLAFAIYVGLAFANMVYMKYMAIVFWIMEVHFEAIIMKSTKVQTLGGTQSS